MQSLYEDSNSLWVFLLIGLILGLIGNSCVLRIYLKKEQKKASAYLTIILASTDIFICLIIVPTRITIQHVVDPSHSHLVCKFIFWYCYGVWGFSCLVLCLVTFERFLTICQHHRWQLSRFQTLALTGAALAVSLAASLSPAVYSRVTVDLRRGNTTYSYFPGGCDVTRRLADAGRVTDDRYVSPTVLFAGYLFMIVFNSVVYSVMFWTLGKYEQEWRMWNSRVTPLRSVAPKVLSVSTVVEHSDGSSMAESSVHQNSRVDQTSRMGSRADCPAKPDGQVPLKIQYSKIISRRLLLMNLIHILSWVPFYLTEFKVIPHSALPHNLFFIAYFINPYIYMLTNPLFRKKVSILCCH